ncbi:MULTISPECIES: M13 family metallopeptidase [Brevibacterium]|uniref:Neutral endopeptidase n=1 Tax=Brevibacterium casei TaxID=33889 RepID=A0A449DB36_9MICO|nr:MULTISPECIES: M13-type metalloendopeptidase [Brevibacterium]MCM1012899.1 peptidase M13 [Brevibacterium sp. XM4083]MCT1446389.1 peptidase M13 [Brevibacterium casei]MCT1548869.1 peptidase M13 [Brevibacterium casei]MCT1559571.1 peptidase M13 [Brevibacterium casei]MCT2207865.1 peptidase M13 [Brevibacterium casei]
MTSHTSTSPVNPESAGASADIAPLESVRPQDDLFRHINGRWIDAFTIPDDRAGDGAMRELFDTAETKVRSIIRSVVDDPQEAGGEGQKVADLFSSFMDLERINELGITPLEATFAAIDSAESKAELANLLGRLETEGIGGLLGGYVTADAKDSDIYALYLVQAGISLPDEDYYFNDDFAEVREKFLAHVQRMSGFAGLGEAAGITDAEVAAKVMAFETALARHHWDRVATRDAEKTYNKHTLAQLRELGPGFDFDAWFAAVAADIDGELETVVVGQPSYVAGMAQVWEDTDLETLKVWLRWSVLTSTASLLTDEIVEEDFDFNSRTLSGTPALRDRWKRGVGLVESLLGEAVGKLYVEAEFPPAAKDAIDHLVDMLIKAYEKSITELDWMSEETKQRALVKLSKFTPKVGYPVKWREYPAEMAADDLVGNVRRAARAEHARQITRIGGEIDRTEWLMTPQTVNAYYHPVMNEIVFPAAILQPPFFDAEGSVPANFGAIGAVIGHEIGHGFDDQGSRYDGDGNLVDWWTAEDRERFEERTKALIDQYDALVPAGLEAGQHVNGALTVGENIGDLGGLSIGWKALELELGRTPTEAEAAEFFAAWAKAWRTKMRTEERVRRLSIDPHSPEEFRCNQVVKNMTAFHDTFGVSESDAMYLAPEARVTIW